MLRSLDTILTWIENVIAAGSLALACGLAILAVILRNLTGDVIFWSEEAIIYLIIFSTFFGAVAVLRHNEHVTVDILPVLLKGRARKVFLVLGGLATVVYGFFVTYLSWELISEPFSRTTITPALKLPLWVVELSIAVGMTLFFIRAVEMVVRTIRTPVDALDKDVFAEEVAAAGLDLDELSGASSSILGDTATAGGASTAGDHSRSGGASASEGDASNRKGERDA